MSNDGYLLFSEQLGEVIWQFPHLAVKEESGRKFLKGILDITNEKGLTVGSYSVEIRFANGFPYRFPDFYEVGKDIPNEADWHKYRDGRCCLTVKPDEILKCKHGITLIEFVSKYCLSFLANHIYFKENKRYFNGDYNHGAKGLKQFYTGLFTKADFNFWCECLSRAFTGKVNRADRNLDCFCGSKKKYKNCHLPILGDLRMIGLQQLIADFKAIYPFQTAQSFNLYTEVFASKS